jgi:hypothetical protein
MQVVSLVAKILPPVPTEAAVPSMTPSPVAAAAAAAAVQQGGKDMAAERKAAQQQRVQFLEHNQALLEKFSRDLLPSLLHVRIYRLPPWLSRTLAWSASPFLGSDLKGSKYAAGVRLQVYASTVQQQVRTQVLTSISRMVYYNSPEMLRFALFS